MSDEQMVNHPPHYTQHPSGVECIDITEHMSLCLGSAVQYIWRAGLKTDTPVIDLKKAVWHINREIERLGRQKVQDLQAIENGMQRALYGEKVPPPYSDRTNVTIHPEPPSRASRESTKVRVHLFIEQVMINLAKKSHIPDLQREEICKDLTRDVWRMVDELSL